MDPGKSHTELGLSNLPSSFAFCLGFPPKGTEKINYIMFLSMFADKMEGVSMVLSLSLFSILTSS